MALQVFRPAAAAVGEVLAMGDQALLQLAGKQRDAVRPRVMPEEVAGHADLAAPAGGEHLLIEPGPVSVIPAAGAATHAAGASRGWSGSIHDLRKTRSIRLN